jgi:hypothetical protein
MKTAPSLRRILLTLTTGATGAVFGLYPAASSAATSQSFQISPPTANYAGDHGTSLKGNIKVTNLTNQPLSLQVGKENFVAKGEEGEIELTDNADPLYSLAPWFTFSTTQVDLPALATKQVDYTIAIAPGAEPGGRYGTIVFSSIPPKLPGGQSGAAVRQDLAGIVFLRINGAANEQLSVASFATGLLGTKNTWTPKTFFNHGPVGFLTRVINDGNVHEKASGTITIKNMLGMQVTKIPLDEHFVIPGAIRRLHNSWPTGSKHPFMLGRYTATMTATYAGGKTLTASTSFTVIPWAAVIILVVIIIVLFLLWRSRRRFGRAFRILAGRE